MCTVTSPILPVLSLGCVIEAAFKATAAAFSSRKARLCNLLNIGLFNVELNVPRRTVS